MDLEVLELTKYNKYINSILKSRGRNNLPLESYFENHHIIPICLGGSNDKTNLISLTAEEHFRAHYILALENPTNIKCIEALCNISFRRSNNQNRYELTKEELQIVKNLNKYAVSIEQKGRIVCYHKDTLKQKSFFPNKIPNNYIIGISPLKHTNKGLKKSNLTKQKLSQSKKGKYIGKHWYNNGINEILSYECPKGYTKGRLSFSEITKANMSIANKGKLYSESTKIKLSNSKKGKKVYNNGKISIRAYECPKGFKPGALLKQSKSCKFYTNGIINKKIYENEPIPNGFYLGMAKNKNLQNRHWWTNGIINKWTKDCPGKDFYLGKTENCIRLRDNTGRFCAK